MNELLNNDWFISGATSILTLLIVPLISWIVNNIKAYNGAFTGCYIAVTRDTNSTIVEFVKCKHINNNIKGKIFGVSISENTEQEPKKLNTAFDFKGSVIERLFVISYKPTEKEDISAGTLTLNGNTSGTAFSGIWGGLEDGEVISSECTWFKCNKKFNLKNDFDEINKMAETYLKKMFIIRSDNFSGKSFSKGG